VFRMALKLERFQVTMASYIARYYIIWRVFKERRLTSLQEVELARPRLSKNVESTRATRQPLRGWR
jgi:hypothetical protein